MKNDDDPLVRQGFNNQIKHYFSEIIDKCNDNIKIEYEDIPNQLKNRSLSDVQNAHISPKVNLLLMQQVEPY